MLVKSSSLLAGLAKQLPTICVVWPARVGRDCTSFVNIDWFYRSVKRELKQLEKQERRQQA